MSPTIDFAQELNDEQLAAVTAADGPVLVIAAAGTGKTRTLVHRVAYLIDRGVHPAGILLLTFTNKAAHEMLDRARDLVGPTAAWPTGGTFHSVGNRILRRHAERIGYERGFTIVDADDSKRLAKQVYNELGLKGRDFPQPQVLLGIFSYAVNTQGDLLELLHDRFEEHPADIGDMMAVHEGYEARKRESGAMDFDDLLVNTLRLFDACPEVLREYQERYHHVMVDEFQDTNALQSEMVDKLAGQRRNLLVVGDDFQSIYAWRGANFRNIMSFPERYEGTQIYKLVTNYRSSPEILAIANQAIAHNPEQFQKELKATRESLQRPVLATMYEGYAQARYLVDQIRMYKREGYRYRDMAVLYRTHYSSVEIDLEFTRESVPFVITSGVRFFEQAHVKDCCALLQTLHNPGNKLAFERLLCLFPGIGERTVDRVWRKLGGQFASADEETRAALAEALPKRAQPHWAPVANLIERCHWDNLLETPGEVVREFIDLFYDRYCLDHFENYDRRMDNLRGLCDHIDQCAGLEEFLDEMALMTNLDTDPGQRGDPRNRDAVQLSTIHQAKGLEWKVVFVVWLVDGIFPSGRSLEEDPLAAEERRLFYVAVTRAEDCLQLLSPRTRRSRDGSTIFYSPSRFIGELGPGACQERNVDFI